MLLGEAEENRIVDHVVGGSMDDAVLAVFLNHVARPLIRPALRPSTYLHLKPSIWRDYPGSLS